VLHAIRSIKAAVLAILVNAIHAKLVLQYKLTSLVVQIVNRHATYVRLTPVNVRVALQATT
jgi:hypothetical protein